MQAQRGIPGRGQQGDGAIDKVASRCYFRGTHSGEFMGIPPTGRRVKVGYIDIWQAEGDRFRKNWIQMDMLGLMQQLRVLPAPPA